MTSVGLGLHDLEIKSRGLWGGAPARSLTLMLLISISRMRSSVKQIINLLANQLSPLCCFGPIPTELSTFGPVNTQSLWGCGRVSFAFGSGVQTQVGSTSEGLPAVSLQ